MRALTLPPASAGVAKRPAAAIIARPAGARKRLRRFMMPPMQSIVAPGPDKPAAARAESLMLTDSLIVRGVLVHRAVDRHVELHVADALGLDDHLVHGVQVGLV